MNNFEKTPGLIDNFKLSYDTIIANKEFFMGFFWDTYKWLFISLISFITIPFLGSFFLDFGLNNAYSIVIFISIIVGMSTFLYFIYKSILFSIKRFIVIDLIRDGMEFQNNTEGKMKDIDSLSKKLFPVFFMSYLLNAIIIIIFIVILIAGSIGIAFYTIYGGRDFIYTCLIAEVLWFSSMIAFYALRLDVLFKFLPFYIMDHNGEVGLFKSLADCYYLAKEKGLRKMLYTNLNEILTNLGYEATDTILDQINKLSLGILSPISMIASSGAWNIKLLIDYMYQSYVYEYSLIQKGVTPGQNNILYKDYEYIRLK